MNKRFEPSVPIRKRGKKIATAAAPEKPSASAVDMSIRKPGRPRAKHSDKENYAQMSLYIRREIRNKTKARLFELGMEFSTLVESLLQDWLATQHKG